MNEVVSEGGAQRPSEAGGGSEILAKVLTLVAGIAMDSEGRKSDGMLALEGLQRAEDREVHLRRMVLAVRPPEVNPEIWLRWLSGGSEPFPKERAKKPAMGQQNSGKELTRRSGKVSSSERKVAAARAALEQAELELARDIEHESSIVSWALMASLSKLMAPMFAMGPAWTLMRVVGPYVEADEMEEELILEVSDEDRRRTAVTVRAQRVELSRRLHAALDLWAGDVHFEIELRAAITAVVERYEPRSEEARAKGRKVRSATEMASSVRPDPAAPRSQVLGIDDDD
jgi:hypothetical protein